MLSNMSQANAAAPSPYRSHEIKAWATSLAFALNTKLGDIMEAAYWFNNCTFIKFYLREVSRLNEDGSRCISAVVAALQQLSAD